MAILAYKVHVVDKNDANHNTDDTAWLLNCYTIKAEATPKSINGVAINGSYWELENNNTVCYIGLIPKTDSHTTYKTPLTIIKNGVEYYAQTQVSNSYSVTIKATSNQSITFKSGGVMTTVTSSDKTVYVADGAPYECYTTADKGYTKGSIDGASANGTVTKNMTITANAATINDYPCSITIDSGVTLSITNTTQGTSAQTFTSDSTSKTFTANYNDKLTISYTNHNTMEYSVTEFKVNGTAWTSGNQYTVPAGIFTIVLKTEKRVHPITLVEGTGSTLSVTANGKAISSGDTVLYGTNIEHIATAKTSYENPKSQAEEVK